MSPELLELDGAALAALLGGPGRARAIYRQLERGADPFSDPALSAKQRARLAAHTRPTALEPVAERVAADGTTKLLFRLEDQREVEAVLIPEPGRTTLCLSTQVGCARGCIFCLTATMKLVRQLSAAEICAQVVAALAAVRRRAMPPLRNVVYMGMGEPLDNADAVERSLERLTTRGLGLGFGRGHVTVSTVAPSLSALPRLISWPCRLAFSLHAAEPELRRRLVPTARHSPQELTAALAEVCRQRGDGLFVELTLIDGENDRLEDARAVLALFADFPGPLRFNLLPLNPIGGALRPSPPQAVQRFAACLIAAGRFTKVRRARGQEESAACGQLATLGRWAERTGARSAG